MVSQYRYGLVEFGWERVCGRMNDGRESGTTRRGMDVIGLGRTMAYSVGSLDRTSNTVHLVSFQQIQ